MGAVEQIHIEPAAVKPIIKWAGGKSWLIPRIVPPIAKFLGESGGAYFEPFLGGGAVALALGHGNMVLTDALLPLMAMYQSVRDRPAAVYRALNALAKRHGGTEEGYYAVRAMTPKMPATQAARFIYLNKFGYNGLYRENSKGGYNVPWGGERCKGRHAREVLPSESELYAVAMALRMTALMTGDYLRTFADIGPADAVYADPPYAGTFASYTAGKFGLEDHAALAQQLRKVAQRGAFVLTTNSDTEFVREQYAWATCLETDERRNINSDGKGRGKVPCLLITNRPGLV